MSINLVTGTPGAGKTLYVVRELVEFLLPQNRPIYHNIAGLEIKSEYINDITDEGVKNWFTFPEHSIFIFDECQRNFPPRNPMSSVPQYISEFETHRHKGMDFYLITQGPQLIDRHLHPLVESHIHLYRPFGLKRSTVFKWNTVNPSPNPRQSRLTSQTRNFSFPKKYFAAYKSASQHTIKARPPWVLLLAVPGLLALVIGTALFFRSFMFDRMVTARSEEMAAIDQDEQLPAFDQMVPAPLSMVVATHCASVVSVTGERVRYIVGGSRFLAEGEQARRLLAGFDVNGVKRC
jgi:zona occludens toxin (predicted ATPase)